MAPSENQYKEWFSRAFLQAASAKAGVAVDFPGNDFYGEDAVLTDGGDTVDFQLKATANLTRDVEQRPQFDLDVPTYNKLRLVNRHAFAYLVVVEVPEARNDWMIHEPSRTVLSRHAYFVLLTGMSKTTNTSTVRITFPNENLLTSQAIEQIMVHSRSRRKPLAV